MYNMTPLYVEFHMVRQTRIQPKACSIEMHFKVCHFIECLNKARTNVPCVYAVVQHTVFIEGKRVEKIWPRSFLLCPKWVYRGKNLLRKKLG